MHITLCGQPQFVEATEQGVTSSFRLCVNFELRLISHRDGFWTVLFFVVLTFGSYLLLACPIRWHWREDVWIMIWLDFARLDKVRTRPSLVRVGRVAYMQNQCLACR